MERWQYEYRRSLKMLKTYKQLDMNEHITIGSVVTLLLKTILTLLLLISSISHVT